MNITVHRIIRFQIGDNVQFGATDLKDVYSLSGNPLIEFKIGKKAGKLENIKLLPPCEPKKIIGLAINYQGATGQIEDMGEPMVFIKPGTSVIGPGDAIKCPFENTKVWMEAELAIVIGKKARNINFEETENYILGFTVANDVTADNKYEWDHHLARSKGADTFCPIGPWIDTSFKPANQTIEGYQNGELLRKGSLDQRLFKEKEIISFLSRWITLEPFDVILTGAPARVRPRQYLEHGDKCVCKIEGLGELENHFEIMSQCKTE